MVCKHLIWSWYYLQIIPQTLNPILSSDTCSDSASYKDTLLNDIRKARDKYQGEELAKELTRIKLRIDNTEVLTQDIVMNLLFSYRDIQVCTTL